MNKRLVLFLVSCLLAPALADARYYSSKTGRFNERDPETPGQVRIRNNQAIVKSPTPPPTNPQDWHPYMYVGNNPVNFVDPYGTQAVGGCLTCFMPRTGIGPPTVPLPEPSAGKPGKECATNASDDEPTHDEVWCAEQCQKQCVDHLLQGDMKAWRRCMEVCMALCRQRN